MVGKRGRSLTDREGTVVFLCPNLEAGGAQRQWAILAPGLADRGFDVSVMTLDGRGVYFEELLARGVPIACARLRHRADPIGLARGAAWGARSSAVLTHGVSAHLVGHVLARRHRAAHVVTEHLGDDPLGMRPLRRHQQLLLRPMRPRANAVVAAAVSQTEHLVRDGYPDAIRVIANGVADDPPVRDRGAVRAELGVAPSAFLAVLVAALHDARRCSWSRCPLRMPLSRPYKASSSVTGRTKRRWGAPSGDRAGPCACSGTARMPWTSCMPAMSCA